MVITIIVLIILAAITLNMLSGQNGVLKKAGEASETQKDAAEKEQVQLAVIAAMTNNDLGQLTDENLRKAISDTFGSDNGLDGFDPGPWTYTGERNVYDIDGNGEIIQSAKLTQEEKDQIVDVVGAADGVVYVLTRGGDVKATTSKTGNIFNKYELTGDPITTKGIRKGDIGLFIDNAGKVYTCGSNGYRQLGDGTTEYRSTPMCISDIPESELNGKKIVDIYQYCWSVFARDNNGKLYTWGENEYGLLGDSTTENKSMPICISDISGSALKNKKIIEFHVSNSNIIAKDNNGKLYTWGYNKYGQLGDGTKNNRSTPICINDIKDGALYGKKITDILDYGYTTIVIDNSNKLYAWGANYSGTVGDGTTSHRSIPICINNISGSVLNGKKIVDYYINSSTIMARDDNGKLYIWGNNLFGRLGDGTTTDRGTPICLSDTDGSALKDKKIVDVLCFKDSIIVKDDNGKLYSWGYNRYGQLGNGIIEKISIPMCISDISGSVLNGKKIVDVYFYGDSVIAKDENGKLYSWGYNRYGQLGDETTENRSTPMCISDISGSVLNGKKIVDVYFYGDSVIAKDENGKLYSWGYNRYGQLGDGSTENRSIPICISDISGSALKDKKIVDVLNTWRDVIVKDENGKIYAWGSNAYGQLGVGSMPICINDVEECELYNKKLKTYILSQGDYEGYITEDGECYLVIDNNPG